jgi:hypothetical protein
MGVMPREPEAFAESVAEHLRDLGETVSVIGQIAKGTGQVVRA